MGQDRCYKNPVAKYVHEYMFWKKQYEAGEMFPSAHYLEHFTTGFAVEKSFYDDKRILDIGCGPCGSLEWADNAARRVGLDPLAEAYMYIGADMHVMEYFPDFAEEIDTPDASFDVVTSMNSLDHVDKPEKVISEIKRVLAPGGHFFLLSEVSPNKKICEPSPVSWTLVESFSDGFEVLDERHLALGEGFLLEAVQAGKPYAHGAAEPPPGALLLKLRKLA